MRKHIDFLGVLLWGWSALSVLVGCATLLLAAGAATIVGSATGPDDGGGIATGVIAAILATIGLMSLLWGGVHAGAGYGIRRYRHWGRPLGLALGVVNLIVLPFGTALGIYALWVLLAPDTRQIFNEPPGHE